MPKAAAAILFWLGILFLLATGAAATSLHGQAGEAAIERVHRSATFAIGGAGAVLLVWLAAGGAWRAAVACAAILAAGVADGWIETNLQPSAEMHTWHAWIAALVAAGAGALAWSLSPAFRRAPEKVQDAGWPSLRFLSAVSVVAIGAQIALGAAYRHDVLGLIPHLFAAPVVALIVILTGWFVVQQFAKHGSLRPIGLAVLILASVQVGLGLVTLVTGMTETVLTRGSLAVRVAHVVTGSLTLTAVLVLAIEVRRKVQRASEP